MRAIAAMRTIPNTTIIDVRETDEYRHGHVEGAVNVPLGQIFAGAGALADVPKNNLLVVYCRTGARSAFAMQALSNMGFTNVVDGVNQAKVEAILKAGSCS